MCDQGLTPYIRNIVFWVGFLKKVMHCIYFLTRLLAVKVVCNYLYLVQPILHFCRYEHSNSEKVNMIYVVCPNWMDFSMAICVSL